MFTPEVISPREPIARPSGPFTVSDYPEGSPVVPPSPVLSMSRLSDPPWNGGSIPIIFDSDEDESTPGALVRLSDHTFGSGDSRTRTPTDSSSITSANTIPSFIDTRPASVANSAVGHPDTRGSRVESFELMSSTPRASPLHPNLVSSFSVSTIDQLSDAPCTPESDDTSLSPYDIETTPSAVDATALIHSLPPPSTSLPPPSKNTGNDFATYPARSSSGNISIMPHGRFLFSPSASSSENALVDDGSKIRSNVISDAAPLLRHSKDDACKYPAPQILIHNCSPDPSPKFGNGSPASSLASIGISGDGQPSSFRGLSLKPTLASPVPVPPQLSGVHDPDIAAAVAKRASSRLDTPYQEQPASKLARASYRRLGSSGSNNQESVMRPTSIAPGSKAIPSGPRLDLARERSNSTDSYASDVSALEPSLRHLKDMVVELYIDQVRKVVRCYCCHN